MRRLLLALLVVVGSVLIGEPLPAVASSCSVPNVFSNGTTADANQVNSNFSALVNCGNNIDNTNVGANGIYASQIKPTTTVQATFGGSVGYAFNPNAVGQVPLTISNIASPTADYFDITNNGGTKLVYVNSAGVLNTNQAPVFGAPLGITSGGTGTTTPALVAGANIGITGAWPNQTVAFSGVLPIANGGTGSSTQNFVDLTTAQTVGGAKTFSSTITGSGGGLFGGLVSAGSNQTFIGSGGGNSAIRTGTGSLVFQDATGATNWATINASSALFNGGLTATNLTASGLTANQCLQTTTGGLLATASGSCIVSGIGSPTTISKYSVTAALGSNCLANTQCAVGTSGGAPNQTACGGQAFNTSSVPNVPVGLAIVGGGSGPTYVAQFYNTSGATINSGTNINVLYVCGF